MAKKVKDPRPSWDEYFMEIANVVAKRSNCSRRHVAAVIVKDRHILSSGYNGTPHGTKNCFEGGCPRCSGKVASGTHLDECLCVHAEQNAICQAAKHGKQLAPTLPYTCFNQFAAQKGVHVVGRFLVGTGKPALHAAAVLQHL